MDRFFTLVGICLVLYLLLALGGRHADFGSQQSIVWFGLAFGSGAERGKGCIQMEDTAAGRGESTISDRNRRRRVDVVRMDEEQLPRFGSEHDSRIRGGRNRAARQRAAGTAKQSRADSRDSTTASGSPR